MKDDKLFLNEGRFWIFQSNAKNDYGFDIRSSSRIQKRIEVWPIKRYAKELREGDFCFIWACGLGNELSGIYSIGKLISDIFPAGRNQYTEYRHGFRYPVKGSEVLVQYIHSIMNHVSRKVFLSDSILKEISIMKYSQATVFRVKEEEKKIILRKIEAAN